MKFLGPAAVLVSGVLFGILLWHFSPAFTGSVEPWDAPGQYYYLASQFLAGVLASVASPRWFVLAAVGVCGGQCIYLGHLLSINPSPFGPLGMFFAAGYSVLALVGGWCVKVIADKVKKRSGGQ